MKEENLLLFDIGGTYTKIAVATNKKIISTKIVETKDFSVEEIKKIIEEYQKSKKTIKAIVLACAGPVRNGKCQLANANLFLDEQMLSIALKIPVKIINDLESVAYFLKQKNKSALLISLGTGLGVSLIDDKENVIVSEEGHSLIEKELFFSVQELKNTIIPQYENVLGGKKNLLLQLLNSSEKEVTLKDKLKGDSKLDRFTELYLKILDSFVQKMLLSHKNINIKKIIFLGGISSGNKKFMEKYVSQLKKKFKSEFEIVDDKFIGVKGALFFYYEKQKNL